MTMQQQQDEERTTGISAKAWIQIVGAVIVLILIIIPFILVLVAAWPTITRLAPFSATVLTITFTVAIPLVLATALVCGVLWLRSHAETKHFQGHLVKPNSNGAYGAYYDRRIENWKQPENAPLPIGVNVPHTLSYQNAPRITGITEEKQKLLTEGSMPDAPSFRSIASLIRKDRLVICYGADGPFFGTVDDLLSSNIVGKPGRGKTLMLYYLIAQFMMIGAEVIAFDPHGSMMEISEYINYEHDYERMSQAVPRVLAVLDERLTAFKAKKPFDSPLLFIIDELPAIAAWEAEQKKAGRKVGKDFHSILSLTKKIILESRKTRFYAVLSGQTISAKVLETDARDNLSSHFVFESTGRHARMGGLESEEIEELLPHLRGAGPGKCVVSLSRESAAFLGAIPETTRNDLVEVADAYGVQKTFLLPERTENTQFSEDLMADLNNVTPLSTKQSKYRDDVTYEDAVVAWNAGHNSKRALAKHLNVSEWTAQGWCKKITEQLREIQEDESDDAEAEESI